MQAVQAHVAARAISPRNVIFSPRRLLSTTQPWISKKSPRARRQGAQVLTLSWSTPASPAHETTAPRFYSSTQARNALASEKTEQKLSAAQRSSRVPIVVNGETVEFSAILLRDSCQCPLCVHESTNQRLFSTADIPSDIQARTIETDAATDSVNITWERDAAGYTTQHTTKIELAALRELSRSSCPPGAYQTAPPQRLWTQKALNLPDYDYNTYMQDDSMLYDVINQLRIDGLAFVNNVPGTEEALATIATRIGPVKDTFYGYTWDGMRTLPNPDFPSSFGPQLTSMAVRTVPEAINAAYTSHDLGFHTDLLYFEQPPHIQLLHCVQSASTGGASVFADAYRAAVDLFHMDLDAFDTLATVPVNYHYNHPDSNVYRTTKPAVDLRPLRIGDTVYTHLQDYIKDWSQLSSRQGGPEWTEAMLVDCMDKINWGPPFLAPFSNHEDSKQ
ncbi:Gamma-butyrobetaine hydroxylase [Colletotrichum higginsianum IMI 349063]|uniref:Gamma-butyrobetaine hydroxylase n=1 Tax=Colletotrichum higginsianum (strain IMI 349063) TaxID=759273 RepID=A0A1B7XR61_COLHI|nr:Gamma-butyrobetaine hydroxylase [Colletotrichum higginsianum IMI 349063]OBR02249.1 Gamma-butyrobetaine hydroxylase [Colletotrichum higginsianum IMI 349063]